MMAKFRAIPEGFMTVGKVAKKMGVTVRTLQYYDKEELLSINPLANFAISSWSSAVAKFLHYYF